MYRFIHLFLCFGSSLILLTDCRRSKTLLLNLNFAFSSLLNRSICRHGLHCLSPKRCEEMAGDAEQESHRSDRFAARLSQSTRSSSRFLRSATSSSNRSQWTTKHTTCASCASYFVSLWRCSLFTAASAVGEASGSPDAICIPGKLLQLHRILSHNTSQHL